MERKREDQRKEFVNRLMKKARVRIHEDAVRQVIDSVSGKERK